MEIFCEEEDKVLLICIIKYKIPESIFEFVVAVLGDCLYFWAVSLFFILEILQLEFKKCCISFLFILWSVL